GRTSAGEPNGTASQSTIRSSSLIRSGEAFFITFDEEYPPGVRKLTGLSPATARNGSSGLKCFGGFTSVSPRRQKSFHELPKPSIDMMNLPATRLLRESVEPGASAHMYPANTTSRR